MRFLLDRVVARLVVSTGLIVLALEGGKVSLAAPFYVAGAAIVLAWLSLQRRLQVLLDASLVLGGVGLFFGGLSLTPSAAGRICASLAVVVGAAAYDRFVVELPPGDRHVSVRRQALTHTGQVVGGAAFLAWMLMLAPRVGAFVWGTRWTESLDASSGAFFAAITTLFILAVSAVVINRLRQAPQSP